LQIDLHNGDCLELMKDIPDGSVDLVLTDPPYGIDYQSQWRKDKAQWKPKIKNDKSPFVDFIPQLKRVMSHSGAAMIFTRWDVQQQFIDVLTTSRLSVKNILIWDKVIHGMGDLKRAYGSRYESIIFCANSGFRFNGKRPTDIMRFQRVSANKLVHPNEKPTEVLETLITQCTRQGQNVLDPFFGSGSTGVACINTGRNFIGIELDETYFNIAQKRIEAAQAAK
jgi:DNA modification methylase